MGATIYYLLTRRYPASSVAVMAGDEQMVPPRQHNPEIPWALQDVIMKMMAIRRENRYTTVEEARAALRRIAAPAGTPVRREFRICALCRHLHMSEEMTQEYLFSCQILGWKTQESRIPEAMQESLQLDSSQPRDCPYWEQC